jgi:YARHG domain
MASRAQRDASLTGEDDNVSEDGFAALYDAIVLSKIALLDTASLNELHWRFTGKGGSVFLQSGLYPAGTATLLLDAVRSIDGNQQWQAVALPYPRAEGRDSGWPNNRQYGRELPPGQSGFRLWGDLDVRSAVFKRIFKGPLNLGLEDHPVYMTTYRFPACEANPFPSTTNNNGDLNKDGDLTCRLLILSAASDQPGRFGALSTEALQRKDFVGLTAWDLRIARNEVFARHGYTFGPPELVSYFGAQPWYRPSGLPASQVNESLTELEWHNVMLIRRLEQGQRLGAPLPALASR